MNIFGNFEKNHKVNFCGSKMVLKIKKNKNYFFANAKTLVFTYSDIVIHGNLKNSFLIKNVYKTTHLC